MSSGKSSHDVSKSALVNLKAELYRKQEQFRQKKQAQAAAGVPVGYQAITGKKLKPESTAKGPQTKSNAGVSQRNEKDLEQRAEEERSWERAKTVLASKAKLYDKLSSEQYIPGEDEDHMLVDFSRKMVDCRPRDSSANAASDDSDLSDGDIGPLPPPASSEEWVEYEDHLGRSRKCLRVDLPHMMAEKERMRQEVDDVRRLNLSGGVSDDPAGSSDLTQQSNGFDFGETPLTERTLLSNDMRREMERQSWERTADGKRTELGEQRNNMDFETETTRPGPITYNPHPKGPVHYETIKNNEIREMGVGYYKFSTDSTKRQEELEHLERLQAQTEEQRNQKEQLKAKRKALADARLAKIRAKKNLPAEPVETKDDDDDLAEFEEMLKPAPVAPTPSAEDVLAARGGVPHVRPWDKGKLPPGIEPPVSKKPDDKTYFANRREERKDEFAPPETYSSSPAKRSRNSRADPDPSRSTNLTPSAASEFYKNVPPPSGFVAAPSALRPPGPRPNPIPPAADYKPWDNVQNPKPQLADDYKPWENLKSDEARIVDERRPYTNAPPPEMYSRDARPMSFDHVDEAEIREQARRLFASNVAGKK